MSILEKIEVKVRDDMCGNPVARAHGKSAACAHSAERAVANLAVKIWGPGEYSRALISNGANGAQLWWIGRPAPGGEATNDRSEVPHAA